MLDPITHDPDALRYLIAKVGAEHVVTGTDLPQHLRACAAREAHQ
jgi:hypothetical protein